MKIVVLSCDKNIDLFEPFQHCMEKYWKEHPQIIYYTESVINPYYTTICVPHELSDWTRGVRQFLDRIDDNIVLLMMDDLFLCKPVDIERFNQVVDYMQESIDKGGNAALFNLEQSWDRNDELSVYPGFKKRNHGSPYEVSIMCGIWDKQKLINVLAPDSDPWQVEYQQNNCGYDYYINAGDFILDWGYRYMKLACVHKGKWTRECQRFLDSEGLHIDYTKRGFID